MPIHTKKSSVTDPTTGIPEAQEKTRSWLAYGSMLIFAIVVIGALGFIVFSNNVSIDRINGILTIISAVTGTLGFVMGFYFGQHHRD
jgi:hypothetical protein